MALEKINVYDAEKGLTENPEDFKGYVIANQFGIPLMITKSGFVAGMLSQSEGEDFMHPQNTHYRLIESAEELLRLQNLITHLGFEKQKIIDAYKKIKSYSII